MSAFPAWRRAALAALLAAPWAAERAGGTGPLSAALDVLRREPRQDAAVRHFRYEALFARPDEDETDAFLYKDPNDILFWKFVPGRRGRFLDHEFAVNADGMGDRERARAKPAGVRRIAVLGASVSLPYGVEQDAGFDSALERRLNGRAGAARRYELLNFAVPGYSLLMMLVQAERKAARYRPDLTLWCVTSRSLAEDLKHLDEAAGWRRWLPESWNEGEEYSSEPYRGLAAADALAAGVSLPRIDARDARAQLEDTLRLARRELARAGVLARRGGGEAALVFLPSLHERREDSALRAGLAPAAAAAGLRFLDMGGAFQPTPREFSLGDPGDHLNARGHERLAERLERALRADARLSARLGLAR